MLNENQYRDRLIRLPELERIFSVCSRTIRRGAEKGDLPPLQHVGRAVGMLQSQVDAHFERLRQTKLKGA
jgi:predicted DNA-binding transcriptional regulator AlpA